jgi:hypothetical protein
VTSGAHDGGNSGPPLRQRSKPRGVLGNPDGAPVGGDDVAGLASNQDLGDGELDRVRPAEQERDRGQRGGVRVV